MNITSVIVSNGMANRSNLRARKVRRPTMNAGENE
jgi:hypothetical protein